MGPSVRSGLSEGVLAKEDGGAAFAGGFVVVFATFVTGFGAGTFAGTGGSIVGCLLGTGLGSGCTGSGSGSGVSSTSGIDCEDVRESGDLLGGVESGEINFSVDNFFGGHSCVKSPVAATARGDHSFLIASFASSPVMFGVALMLRGGHSRLSLISSFAESPVWFDTALRLRVGIEGLGCFFC